MIKIAFSLLCIGSTLISIPFVIRIIEKLCNVSGCGAYSFVSCLIMLGFYFGILLDIISFLLFVRYI